MAGTQGIGGRLGTPVTAEAAGPAGPAVEAEGLRITYTGRGIPVHAVRGVDLQIGRGELVGLVGESGCGKSSVAMALLGLLPRETATVTGAVRVAGRPVLGASEGQLRDVRLQRAALVPQSAMNALSPVLRVGEQIVDVIRAHERISKPKALARAVESLRRVGLEARHAASYPHELSGGMRQRAVIAMATVLHPDLLIMDEPTTALDVVTQQHVLEQVQALSADLDFAVLLITHDLPLLLGWAERIVVMYAGSIVESGPAAELAARPQHPYTEMLLRSFPPLTGPRRELAVIPGQPWDLREQADQCLFADRCPSAMDACRAGPPRLTAHGERTVACFLRDPQP